MAIQNLKIFITGGAGFIGTHIAERFCEENEIVLFDNLRRNSLSGVSFLNDHDNIRFIQGDVLEKEEIYRAMEGCDIVLHLAAIAGVSSYYNEPAKTLNVNVKGTINVLDGCRDLGIKKFIDFSTSEVYGSDAYDVRENETHGIGPVDDLRWTYATSKLISEHFTFRYGESYDFKVFTIRPFNIYGPRQTGEGAISNFFTAIAQSRPITVYGDGTPIRSWCYVSDCVDGVERILANENLEPGAFNIGNPRETYTTLGLARLVLEVAGVEVPIVFKDIDRTEIKVRMPNIEKARNLLGYEPQVDLLEGLTRTYEWFKKTL